MVTGLITLATISFLVLSFGWWSELKGIITFNASWLETGWQSLAMFILILGALVILVRRPNGWGYALSMLLLSLVGHSIDLILPNLEGDFPGAVRLTQLAAYPLLLALPRRFLLSGVHLESAEEPTLIRDRR
jgi:hypothetical protein